MKDTIDKKNSFEITLITSKHLDEFKRKMKKLKSELLPNQTLEIKYCLYAICSITS